MFFQPCERVALTMASAENGRRLPSDTIQSVNSSRHYQLRVILKCLRVLIFQIVNPDIITRKRSFMTLKIVFLIIKCLYLVGPMFYHGHKGFYAVFVYRWGVSIIQNFKRMTCFGILEALFSRKDYYHLRGSKIKL